MDLTQTTITEAARAQMATTQDARLREVIDALVRNLHDFAREVRLTPAEWLAGIRFLTETGAMCDATRQEFILLSDVLGLSALVNLMHDATATTPEGGMPGTVTSLLGPFFREDAPVLPAGACIVTDPRGEQVLLHGLVLDAHGHPVAGATIDIWQTNEDGLYDVQLAGDGAPPIDMRGRFRTDAAGRYLARTVLPRGYAIPMDGPVGALVRSQGRHGFRPAHIHLLVTAPGHRDLVTALYIADDAHIDSDTVFGVSDSLRVMPAPADATLAFPSLRRIPFDLRLAAGASGRVGADSASLRAAQ